MIVCGRLEVANNELKLLLEEADKETIKENIPEAARAQCLKAWSTASNICLRSNQVISEKKMLNIEEYLSAGRTSLTRTKAAGKLLAAITGSLELQSVIHNTPWLSCR